MGLEDTQSVNFMIRKGLKTHERESEKSKLLENHTPASAQVRQHCDKFLRGLKNGRTSCWGDNASCSQICVVCRTQVTCLHIASMPFCQKNTGFWCDWLSSQSLTPPHLTSRWDDSRCSKAPLFSLTFNPHPEMSI